ncbi:phosphopantetheine-binding protein [Dactylosporangium sp. NPDC005555]|uniref:phosphopantetheine-binding protein n=1 Tax=Dactylosporangium sp. NPDC005555 TaxID=3154889 RepID=UPI0033A1732D
MPSYDLVTEVLTREWRTVLGVPEVRENDEFFALGGNSLLAVTMMERVEAELGFEFPLEAIFVDGTFGAVLTACHEASTE